MLLCSQLQTMVSILYKQPLCFLQTEILEKSGSQDSQKIHAVSIVTKSLKVPCVRQSYWITDECVSQMAGLEVVSSSL